MKRRGVAQRYMFNNTHWTPGQEPVIHQYGFGQYRPYNRRQNGYGPFRSRRRRQRGYGFFGSLWKVLGRTAKVVAPVLKKHALRAGRRALKQAPKLLSAQNKRNAAREILKSVGRRTLSGIAADVENRGNSRQRRPNKRRRYR